MWKSNGPLLGFLPVSQPSLTRARLNIGNSYFNSKGRGRFFHSQRISKWEELCEKYKRSMDKNQKSVEIMYYKEGESIKLAGISHLTTPKMLFDEIATKQPSLLGTLKPEELVIAELDGKQWDLTRPIESDVNVLKFYTFSSTTGKKVFWHSSSHILGSALELYYKNNQKSPKSAQKTTQPNIINNTPNDQQTPKDHEQTNEMTVKGGIEKYECLLADGPALESGFFYDCFIQQEGDETSTEGKSIRQEDCKTIEKWAQSLQKKNLPFERILVSREDAIELFQYNRFKLKLIERIPEGAMISLYKLGDFIDLCSGPHLPSSEHVKVFNVTKTSSIYWDGDVNEASMQRIHAISFPSPEVKVEYDEMLKRSKENDHRVIGKDQQLFMQHSYSPGSPFFLPHGTRILQKLQNYLRSQYRTRGYLEVITPNIFTKQLWQQSGHWDNYKDNMFSVISESKDGSKEEFGLKPMNCPSHCLIFLNQARSYRDLPLRIADFGALHRDELAGALTGLTRVRKLQQDDAHIFCTEQQIKDEIKGCLDLVKDVYSKFGFTFKLALSTRPESFIGDIELWEKAENALKNELIDSKMEWEFNVGDGAFYGPKIDITVTDAHHRQHQCATIQLDFQLPRRFGLQYADQDGTLKTPVMIHRAVLGSLERMFALLIEHFGGRWPLWLSPRQVSVCPVSSSSLEYARSVYDRLHAVGFHVDLDDSDHSLTKKIRNASSLRYNYVLILGEKEAQDDSVSFRKRGSPVDSTSLSFAEFVNQLNSEVNNFE